MNITDNLIRIKEGKDNIIKSLKNKGVSIADNTLINEIPTIIDNAEISGGGGSDTPVQPETPELVQKYEGASVFRIEVPTDNYLAYIGLKDSNLQPLCTYNVDWGDNTTIDENCEGDTYHFYDKKGVYDINLYNLSKDISLGNLDIQICSIFTTQYNNNVSFTSTPLQIGSNDKLDTSQYIINILIGSNITSIGSYAFQNCSRLQSITIPEGIKKIGSYAFYGCSSLQNITIPSSVTSIGSYAFQYCSSLQTITIPEGVTRIENYAFQYCSSLQSISIPEGVTKIDSNTFSNCSSLQNITIPSSVTSIGSSAFYNCSSLQSISIPEGVTKIDSNTFNNCSSLQNISIPSSVTSIGSNAFQSCSLLSTIILKAMTPPSIQSNTFSSVGTKVPSSISKILYIPEGASDYESGDWKSYIVDKGFEISNSEPIFQLNDYQKDVIYTINNNLLKVVFENLFIDKAIYDNQENIWRLSFNYISQFPRFSRASQLLSVVIPEGVTGIGTSSFSMCVRLMDVIIPSSVKNISDSAFYYCYRLSTITCKAMTAPSLGSINPFDSVGSQVKDKPKVLRVPEGATGYDSGNWKTYVLNKGYTLEYVPLSEL